ncbi:hypothetical protein OVN18_12895 [Microcella daejeonensis]|uniref:Uncharacterized protein n=1 Tax=Microcella daejeonensis TaxID=2994971 RepID=A0A9E8SBB5_9MICO|nr:hypothetical protein [Microcella daejeonensis]WAB81412.1 hypothetical protein OVN18_12895 [Microcella daejeonensis]
MDTVSLLMGAVIASIVWICVVPWSKLARLREFDAQRDEPGTE